MRLIDNTGTNRVIDVLRQAMQKSSSIAIASPLLSLFGFAAVRDLLDTATRSRRRNLPWVRRRPGRPQWITGALARLEVFGVDSRQGRSAGVLKPTAAIGLFH